MTFDETDMEMIRRGDMLGPKLGAKVATALEALQRERDAWRKAAVEAVIPLEALNAAGRGMLSEAAWTEVQNGIREVRATLEAYPPARALSHPNEAAE